eukprot:442616-Prorocentrum_minimum.AAC.2
MIETVTYKPKMVGRDEHGGALAVPIHVGFAKEAPLISLYGYCVYYKNRLIKTYDYGHYSAWSTGRGVIGYLEADKLGVQPAHDKQDFESTPNLQRLKRSGTLQFGTCLTCITLCTETRVPFELERSSYLYYTTSFYGFSYANNGKDALNTPDIVQLPLTARQLRCCACQAEIYLKHQARLYSNRNYKKLPSTNDPNVPYYKDRGVKRKAKEREEEVSDTCVTVGGPEGPCV